MLLRLSFLALVSLAILACTSHIDPADSGNGGACPQDLPATCPTVVPSYQTTIAPVISLRCLACHGDGGIEVTKRDLSNYAAVFKERSAVLNQVYACSMPPAASPALTADERKALLDWLVCHAPNN